MAEGNKEEKKEKQTNCSSCNKPIKKLKKFYKNNKFYCSKKCFIKNKKKATTEEAK